MALCVITLQKAPGIEMLIVCPHAHLKQNLDISPANKICIFPMCTCVWGGGGAICPFPGKECYDHCAVDISATQKTGYCENYDSMRCTSVDC